MVLGILEDFSSNIVLDAELLQVPSSGLYLNSGVHPTITLNNLLEFLPFNKTDFLVWDVAKTYFKYNDSRKKLDLVTLNNKIYQSISNNNVGKNPTNEPSFWLETNLESLKLKSFIEKVKDRVNAELNLTKRLVNNQFIYEVGDNEVQLPNNYAAWIFEPKGSDYVSITLNQVSFQKNSISPVNLYVINQGVLIDTLIVTPKNGKLDFDNIDYTFKGKGKWIFAIESTNVIVGQGIVDSLKYDGFVCYTASGIGNTPESSKYSQQNFGNGLGFNISATLESSLFIENNISNFGNFYRATFELMALQTFVNNSNNRSNTNVFIDRELLIAETKSLEHFTVAKKYQDELKRAKAVIDKVFDTQLILNEDFQIILTSV